MLFTWFRKIIGKLLGYGIKAFIFSLKIFDLVMMIFLSSMTSVSIILLGSPLSSVTIPMAISMPTMMASKHKRTLVLRSVPVLFDQCVQEKCLDRNVFRQQGLRQSPHCRNGKVRDEVNVSVL